MVRRTTIMIAVGLLVASPLMARKLTTTQIRENTIRINALELEGEKAEKVEIPKTIVLDSTKLKFDFDKSVVKPEYYGLLRNVKEYVEQNDLKVLIVGHTDSKGSDAYNMALGMRRAVAVKNKLLEFGLSSSRILGVESRGESEPVTTNDTAEGRAQNRRIEFKLEK